MNFYELVFNCSPGLWNGLNLIVEEMLAAIQRLKGFQDILPEDRRYWDYLISTATELATRYGFVRVDVPILENNALFERGIGTASDFFIKKEMYSIDEGDGEIITLRPEFTAGLVRAYVQNGLHNWPQPVKIFTFGPIFRRERPQAGRFRQHSQFDCEILGETDPAADLEIMQIAINLYREMGYKGLIFQLNSIGCPTCKPDYLRALQDYLAEHRDRLSPLDRERLEKNPLRILDSKEEGMEEILSAAPKTIDYLCLDCESHFSDLRHLLDVLDESYVINHRLVRGIDYYTKTAFEVWDTRIGAQAALCGGGRYDGLAEAIGGPSTPGVGFGLGIERAVLGMKEEGIVPETVGEPELFISHFGGTTKTAAIELAAKLRAAGLGVRVAFARGKRSLKSQLREANKYPTRFALIVGEDELAQGMVTVRPMGEGEQQRVPIADLVQWLQTQPE